MTSCFRSVLTPTVVISVMLMCMLGVCGLCAASAAEPAPPRHVNVLIGFEQPPGPNERATVRRHGGSIKHSFQIVPAVAASVPAAALPALTKERGVAVVEPDGVVQAIDLQNTWGVKRIGGGQVHQGTPTMPSALGTGVRVAVIDSGIDYTHADLAANYAGGYNFVNRTTNAMDDNGHGTHVAGTVAAQWNGVGVVGAAPEASLFGLKVLAANGSGSWSDIVASLDWCIANGIEVANNSYGASDYPGTIVERAFQRAEAAGIVMVAAAGNTGTSRGTGDNVNYPARFPSVIAVAATTNTDARASFSSTGATVELAAPGASIRSTLRGGGYGTMSGTSMAAPHVAGVAALVLGAGAAPETVRELLSLTAEDLGAEGWDPHFGFGLVDAELVVSLVSDASPVEPAPAEPAPAEPGQPAPAEPALASVIAIGYSTSGGKNSDKHLDVALLLADDQWIGVAGASVEIALLLNGSPITTVSGVTNADGMFYTSVNNARAGTWSSIVTDVKAAGYTWDGSTPPNSFKK